ncbi:putative secreted protein [Rhodopirellula maiorica SM1]|uniref:Putative secreted protein n=1 Tax=Rhodopirellula maiorica SM1 TaxID=1265738 RepID=M5RC13_9BACT|nr:hypothetical protein [Rhodopirellula maiorica]EMI17028.1 putative secreted protein [Rhodopirellula maiorica SM1]
MKIDRYNHRICDSKFVPRFTSSFTRRRGGSKGIVLVCLCAVFLAFSALDWQITVADTPFGDTEAVAEPSDQAAVLENEEAAKKLLRRVTVQLASGPAFESKVRQRVWTTGREVVGVGTYEQSGHTSGQFNFQMTMHDGEGKHTLQQMSDGRLAWTRTEVAGEISLRRVDVARLDEWSASSQHEGMLPLRVRVGGWIELIEQIQRDHQLQIASGKLQGQPVWVVTATLPESVQDKVMQSSGREEWPTLYPVKVCVVISKVGNKESGFGKFLPLRIEHWSRVMDEPSGPETDEIPQAERLISLVELYSIRQIAPPPIERFRFENRDAEVNFTNETDRYLKQFGVHVAELKPTERYW